MKKKNSMIVGLAITGVVGMGLLFGNAYGQSTLQPIPELVLPVEGQAVDEFELSLDLLNPPSII
ncbi:hypothetical protein [Brevibacillus nitrificans]|uniref:hypothetical protein n=1 Tax=Brevibacillus nitrificans TaxID=651560 RepID=UPI00285F81F2|nr:hypothetical protein [Brevibacillus nitrificans]MDR7319540.1 hypothetical protein [Brevibacillus nitrificans]